MFGGNISVESNINVGTQFTFSLPLALAEKEIVSLQKEIPNELPDSFNWSAKHILIAEDEYSNFLLLEEILESTHVNITWARNGREAVEAYLQNNHMDLVLMDIKMPVMSGFEAYKEIRKLDKEIPIVAQTAYAMTDEREQFQQIGFNGYLTKPLSKKELLITMASFLK